MPSRLAVSGWKSNNPRHAGGYLYTVHIHDDIYRSVFIILNLARRNETKTQMQANNWFATLPTLSKCRHCLGDQDSEAYQLRVSASLAASANRGDVTLFGGQASMKPKHEEFSTDLLFFTRSYFSI